MAPTLRRFLHLERPRPARPDPSPAQPGVEARFDAVLRDVEPAAQVDATRSGDALPILRWLRRRWW